MDADGGTQSDAPCDRLVLLDVSGNIGWVCAYIAKDADGDSLVLDDTYLYMLRSGISRIPRSAVGL
jgi:hypothetical protein